MAQQTDHIGDTNKMVTMKLYTEEQLRRAMLHSYLSGVERPADYLPIEESILRELTPIELPSDEEIERVAKDKINLSNDCFGQYDFTSGKQDGFLEGVYWLKEQILNQNK